MFVYLDNSATTKQYPEVTKRMNFQLTKEQEFVRKMVREFATNEVDPIAADIDKEHRFPTETVEKMAKYGMFRL